jgi:hypothetical protein
MHPMARHLWLAWLVGVHLAATAGLAGLVITLGYMPPRRP